AALLEQADAVLERQGAGVDVGRVLAERESRGRLGRGEALLGGDLQAGDAVDEQRGLAAVGAVELLGRPLEADLGEVELEDRRRAVEQLLRLGERGGQVLAHADGLGALAREEVGDPYHRSTTVPHVMPAPIALIRIRSPRFTRPARTASSSAIGIDAADVLPYSAMLMTIFSIGKPSRSATASIIRAFIWWGMKWVISVIFRS